MGRDLRLDSVRGLLLAQIAFVHGQSPFASNITEAFGRVSTAAGFIFVSGVVGGAVYSRIADRGMREIFKTSVRRACQIHSYHIATYLLLLSVVLVIPRSNEFFRFAFQNPGITVGQTAAYLSILMYQPLFFDILPIYTLYVLFMPLALTAFRHGRSSVVFAISLALWVFAQTPAGDMATWTTELIFRPYGGAFNPLAWQIVFFAGLYLGHMHMHRGLQVVRSNAFLMSSSLLIFLLGLSLRWRLLDWPDFFDDETLISDKQNFGIAYLVNCSAFAYLIYCLARQQPRFFIWRRFAFLGQHSLQVFSFHVIMVYMLRPLFWRAAAFAGWSHDLLGILLVLSLWLPAALHARIRSGRKRRSAIYALEQ